MAVFTHLVVVLVLLLGAGGALSQDVYVSPTGNDESDGTADQPFRTLARARDAVRERLPEMNADVVVHIAGGRYPLAETIVLLPEDSGRDGHRVIYASDPDESAIITGGVTVTDWKLHDRERNLYRAPVKVGGFRQLYIDDQPAVRARTPNRESATTRGPYWPARVEEKPTVRITGEHWEACAEVPKERLNEVEMVMVCHWYHQRVRIGDVTPAGDDVEITPVRSEGKFNKVLHFYQNNRGIKNPFYFENALAFVDAPMEWYHDEDEGFLYLCLPAETRPDALRIEVPVIETLVEVRGAADRPVSGLEFRGVTFRGSNWTSPSEHGVNMTQAAQVIAGSQPSGMVEARHTRSLTFSGCTFRNAGGHAMLLVDADHTDIANCRFDHIAANGIDIDRGGGNQPPPDKQSINVAVWNNHATRCGDHYSNGVFLLAANVRGLIVEHNLIHDLPYSGMQIGQQPGEMRDVGCGDNRVRFNHIHHTNQIHGDGGGIYTLGGIQTGTVISDNFIHDIHQSPLDHYKVDHIYLDNFSSSILVKDNVIPGGRVAQRNGAAGSTLEGNVETNPEVERAAGIREGYDPRTATGEHVEDVDAENRQTREGVSNE